MLFEPDKSLEQCYESLKLLKDEAQRASQELSESGDPALASLLSSLYIANQNQCLILWHMLAILEKKIEGGLDGEQNNFGKRPKWL